MWRCEWSVFRWWRGVGREGAWHLWCCVSEKERGGGGAVSAEKEDTLTETGGGSPSEEEGAIGNPPLVGVRH